jgi:hypothetical protein
LMLRRAPGLEPLVGLLEGLLLDEAEARELLGVILRLESKGRRLVFWRCGPRVGARRTPPALSTQPDGDRTSGGMA